jgi:hypothetical protein
MKYGILKFKIDLGIELLNYVIGSEWKDFNGPKPK